MKATKINIGMNGSKTVTLQCHIAMELKFLLDFFKTATPDIKR